MIHARDDYQPIQDPRQEAPGLDPIGEDEPVFLIRAKDVCAPDAVQCWAEFAELAGADAEIVELAMHWVEVIREWQINNFVKVPDLSRTPNYLSDNPWILNKVCRLLDHAWQAITDEFTEQIYYECSRCGAVKKKTGEPRP